MTKSDADIDYTHRKIMEITTAPKLIEFADQRPKMHM